jgi:hypothetical protein
MPLLEYCKSKPGLHGGTVWLFHGAFVIDLHKSFATIVLQVELTQQCKEHKDAAFTAEKRASSLSVELSSLQSAQVEQKGQLESMVILVLSLACPL